MLSLCMIVKNEETQLPSFLEHIHDLVDEIIIVDTGSKDKTKEIAIRFPKVKLFTIHWQQDFSKARNESLKHASGDWILILDADERISKQDKKKILILVKKKRYSGFYFTQRNYRNDPNTRYFITKYKDSYEESQPFLGWTENHITRLFQRKPEYFYCYKVHEIIEPSIEAAQGKIGMSGIPIHHYGQVEEKDIERKFKQYLEINQEKCKENPYDERAWFEQGINHLKLKEYEKAVDCFEQVYNLDEAHPLVCSYLVEVYGKLKDAQGIISSFQRGVEINPLDVHLYLNIGVIFLINQKYTEASKAYHQALNIDKRNIVAWFGLGVSAYHLGEEGKARKALKNVLKLYPEHPKAK